MSYKRGAKSQDKLVGKDWRIQAESVDGLLVTLGKYDTKEGAETDMARIEEEGFYRKPTITYTPPVEPKPGEEEAKAEAVVVEERRPRARRTGSAVVVEEPDFVAAVEEEVVAIEGDEPIGEEDDPEA